MPLVRTDGRHPFRVPVRAEARTAVGQLVDSAAAQAREAGRRLRRIHRLWSPAWEDREIDRAPSAGPMPSAADDLVCFLLETGDQLVRDVADEIGPALHLPAGTALDRVREALVLGLHLPAALEALEAGRFSARHASVIAAQWRELAEDAPPGRETPPALGRRLADELVEQAPQASDGVARDRALPGRSPQDECAPEAAAPPPFRPSGARDVPQRNVSNGPSVSASAGRRTPEASCSAARAAGPEPLPLSAPGHASSQAGDGPGSCSVASTATR